MGHVYFTVFTLIEHGDMGETRGYDRVARGVHGSASVAVGGQGGKEGG